MSTCKGPTPYTQGVLSNTEIEKCFPMVTSGKSAHTDRLERDCRVDQLKRGKQELIKRKFVNSLEPTNPPQPPTPQPTPPPNQTPPPPTPPKNQHPPKTQKEKRNPPPPPPNLPPPQTPPPPQPPTDRGKPARGNQPHKTPPRGRNWVWGGGVGGGGEGGLGVGYLPLVSARELVLNRQGGEIVKRMGDT